jgi:hypothetical protein
MKKKLLEDVVTIEYGLILVQLYVIVSQFKIHFMVYYIIIRYHTYEGTSPGVQAC